MTHLLLILAAVSGAPGGPRAESVAINAAYGTLAAERAEGDAKGMARHFEPLALLIDARPGPVLDGQGLEGQLSGFVDRLKTNGVTIESQYRVERRTVSKGVAVDAGYMRARFTGGAPGAAKPQDMVRRFLVTWQQGADGQWRIIGDAALPATEAQWQALKPVPGLRFD